MTLLDAFALLRKRQAKKDARAAEEAANTDFTVVTATSTFTSNFDICDSVQYEEIVVEEDGEPCKALNH